MCFRVIFAGLSIAGLAIIILGLANLIVGMFIGGEEDDM